MHNPNDQRDVMLARNTPIEQRQTGKGNGEKKSRTLPRLNLETLL